MSATTAQIEFIHTLQAKALKWLGTDLGTEFPTFEDWAARNQAVLISIHRATTPEAQREVYDARKAEAAAYEAAATCTLTGLTKDEASDLITILKD